MLHRGPAATRLFSTKIQRTPEEIKAGLEKVKRFKKHIQSTPYPKTFVYGAGATAIQRPENVAEISALNFMPAEQQNRTVVISQRPNKTLQSGDKFSNQWQISWKSGRRWSNPLMGWTSTNDPMSNVKLWFQTKEDAIAFANKSNWKFECVEATEKVLNPPGTNLYKQNFLDKRTAGTLAKLGHKNKIFQLPTYGESHWFMPLKYHGDGEVVQHGPKAAAK